jgi:hypothetical protein
VEYDALVTRYPRACVVLIALIRHVDCELNVPAQGDCSDCVPMRKLAARAVGAIPAVPIELLMIPAMQPATAVPWRSQALVKAPSPTPLVAPVVKLRPGARFRSGCVSSTPVSKTATTMSGLPVVMSHAGTARMSAPTVPPD